MASPYYDVYDAGDFDELPDPHESGLPGTRYHVLEYPERGATPRTGSHPDIDDALEFIAEGPADFYRYVIEPCVDSECDICGEAYADEQG
jgi:hypothetical protein